MDVADIASDIEELRREASLDAHRAAQAQYAGPSATHCESCGEAIPEARRLALSGVVRCVICQGFHERMTR